MDDESVRSATRSELNTFQVLANTEFANLQRPAPTSWGGAAAGAGLGAAVLESVEEKQEHVEQPTEQPDLTERREHENEEPFKEADKVPDRSVSMPRSVHTEVSEVVKKHEYSARAKEEAAVDVAIEKESLLYELEMMEKQGSIKLHRQLTMADSLESIQYQYDRANMIVSTQQTVEWAKTGIKMGSGLLETVVKKFGLSVVDGFSNNLCKDMNKFNQPLTKIPQVLAPWFVESRI
jgi:hypothetical protein